MDFCQYILNVLSEIAVNDKAFYTPNSAGAYSPAAPDRTGSLYLLNTRAKTIADKPLTVRKVNALNHISTENASNPFWFGGIDVFPKQAASVILV
ncbi:MAG: hypothetical protein FWB83_09355 [Treponema sp.]|nr:hypothetical protein [Treponema sp.]